MDVHRPSNSLCGLPVLQCCKARTARQRTGSKSRLTFAQPCDLWAFRAERKGFAISERDSCVFHTLQEITVLVGLQDGGFSILSIPRRVVARGNSSEGRAPMPLFPEDSGMLEVRFLPPIQPSKSISKMNGIIIIPSGEDGIESQVESRSLSCMCGAVFLQGRRIEFSGSLVRRSGVS